MRRNEATLRARERERDEFGQHAKRFLIAAVEHGITHYMGFKFVRSYWSIRGAAKRLRVSRKRARWLELNHRLMICRR